MDRIKFKVGLTVINPDIFVDFTKGKKINQPFDHNLNKENSLFSQVMPFLTLNKSNVVSSALGSFFEKIIISLNKFGGDLMNSVEK